MLSCSPGALPQIRDLLENKKKGQSDLTELQLRFDKEGKNYIDGVSVHTILTYDRVVDLIVRGFDSRKVAATDMNQRSSRSHCIIILKLLQKHEQGAGKRDLESTINIVDLAGSERQGKTGVTGEQAVQVRPVVVWSVPWPCAMKNVSRRSGSMGLAKAGLLLC